jgi:hypothetical protein
MNTKSLAKALKFACLPTLSLLLLLFFAFFSISKTVEFISSDDGLAITLRIVAFVAEVVLIGYYYAVYVKEEIIKGNTTTSGKRSVSGRSDLCDLENNWRGNDDYYVHKTESPNIVYIERVSSSSD